MAKVTADKLGKFRPQIRNANRHTQRGMGQLEASMRKYGYVTPMTAAADGEIIDGSARAETGATVFGDDVLVVHHDGTKPVIMVRDDIPSADTPEARGISIAANRIAQVNLDFDPEVLLGDLQAGVDLAQFWRQDELDELLADLTPKTTGDTEPQTDRAEELREKWGVVSGQLWELDSGNGHAHRLICGDCTDAATVARVLQRDKPKLMVTDPPYGVEYDPHWRDDVVGEFGQRAARGNAALNDDRVDWTDAFRLFDGTVAYVWHAGRFTAEVQVQLINAGFEIRNHIVWAKQHFALSRGNYHWQHEPCWYAVRKGQSAQWCGDRTQSTLWEIASLNPAGRQEEREAHGTQKPIECMARPIRNHGAVGDVVYEPFSGSGTTLIACENLSRRCRAVEISPAYVAVTLQRWADHTQRTPVLIG